METIFPRGLTEAKELGWWSGGKGELREDFTSLKKGRFNHICKMKRGDTEERDIENAVTFI